MAELRVEVVFRERDEEGNRLTADMAARSGFKTEDGNLEVHQEDGRIRHFPLIGVHEFRTYWR